MFKNNKTARVFLKRCSAWFILPAAGLGCGQADSGPIVQPRIDEAIYFVNHAGIQRMTLNGESKVIATSPSIQGATRYELRMNKTVLFVLLERSDRSTTVVGFDRAGTEMWSSEVPESSRETCKFPDLRRKYLPDDEGVLVECTSGTVVNRRSLHVTPEGKLTVAPLSGGRVGGGFAREGALLFNAENEVGWWAFQDNSVTWMDVGERLQFATALNKDLAYGIGSKGMVWITRSGVSARLAFPWWSDGLAFVPDSDKIVVFNEDGDRGGVADPALQEVTDVPIVAPVGYRTLRSCRSDRFLMTTEGKWIGVFENGQHVAAFQSTDASTWSQVGQPHELLSTDGDVGIQFELVGSTASLALTSDPNFVCAGLRRKASVPTPTATEPTFEWISLAAGNPSWVRPNSGHVDLRSLSATKDDRKLVGWSSEGDRRTLQVHDLEARRVAKIAEYDIVSPVSNVVVAD